MFAHLCMHMYVKTRGHLQGILRWNILKGRQVTDVLIIEPFDFEVKIHVFSTFAKAVLVMFYKADKSRISAYVSMYGIHSDHKSYYIQKKTAL